MIKYKYKDNEHGYVVLGSPFLYRQYKRGNKSPINHNQWKGIILDTMQEIWRAVVEDLWRFEVPYLDNEIFIMEIMGEGIPVNWKITKKKRKKVVNNNMHTNGRLFKIVMKRTHKSAKITRIYKFVPLRGDSKAEFIGKRGLASYIKRCATDPMIPDFRGHIC